MIHFLCLFFQFPYSNNAKLKITQQNQNQNGENQKYLAITIQHNSILVFNLIQWKTKYKLSEKQTGILENRKTTFSEKSK